MSWSDTFEDGLGFPLGMDMDADPSSLYIGDMTGGVPDLFMPLEDAMLEPPMPRVSAFATELPDEPLPPPSPPSASHKTPGVRKACVECRRRKRKCVWAADSDACTGCQQRGLVCAVAGVSGSPRGSRPEMREVGVWPRRLRALHAATCDPMDSRLWWVSATWEAPSGRLQHVSGFQARTRDDLCAVLGAKSWGPVESGLRAWQMVRIGESGSRNLVWMHPLFQPDSVPEVIYRQLFTENAASRSSVSLSEGTVAPSTTTTAIASTTPTVSPSPPATVDLVRAKRKRDDPTAEGEVPARQRLARLPVPPSLAPLPPFAGAEMLYLNLGMRFFEIAPGLVTPAMEQEIRDVSQQLMAATEMHGSASGVAMTPAAVLARLAMAGGALSRGDKGSAMALIEDAGNRSGVLMGDSSRMGLLSHILFLLHYSDGQSRRARSHRAVMMEMAEQQAMLEGELLQLRRPDDIEVTMYDTITTLADTSLSTPLSSWVEWSEFLNLHMLVEPHILEFLDGYLSAHPELDEMHARALQRAKMMFDIFTVRSRVLDLHLWHPTSVRDTMRPECKKRLFAILDSAAQLLPPFQPNPLVPAIDDELHATVSQAYERGVGIAEQSLQTHVTPDIRGFRDGCIGFMGDSFHNSYAMFLLAMGQQEEARQYMVASMSTCLDLSTGLLTDFWTMPFRILALQMWFAIAFHDVEIARNLLRLLPIAASHSRTPMAMYTILVEVFGEQH